MKVYESWEQHQENKKLKEVLHKHILSYTIFLSKGSDKFDSEACSWDCNIDMG